MAQLVLTPGGIRLGGCSMSIRLRHGSMLAVFACVTLLVSSPSFAQFAQQGQKLVASDFTGVDEQGISVAISSDGNTAIVGAPSAAGGVGGAWVWTRDSAGVWTQQGSRLVGSATLTQRP